MQGKDSTTELLCWTSISYLSIQLSINVPEKSVEVLGPLLPTWDTLTEFQACVCLSPRLLLQGIEGSEPVDRGDPLPQPPHTHLPSFGLSNKSLKRI